MSGYFCHILQDIIKLGSYYVNKNARRLMSTYLPPILLNVHRRLYELLSCKSYDKT